MQRLKAFLVADAAIIGFFAIFILWKLSRRGMETQFRDDLWAERKMAEKLGKLPEFEAKVDQKILLEHRPDPKEKPETVGASQEFRVPSFRGSPHEVLGIPANADSSVINRAFKHWIKKYHPDRVTHLGKGYVDQARRRAEQLNTARQALLAKANK